jgi:hypothetical protein
VTACALLLLLISIELAIAIGALWEILDIIHERWP